MNVIGSTLYMASHAPGASRISSGVPSAEAGVAGDFDATFAARAGLMEPPSGTATGRAGQAPAATSFSEGALFGTAATFFNASFETESQSTAGLGLFPVQDASAKRMQETPQSAAAPNAESCENGTARWPSPLSADAASMPQPGAVEAYVPTRFVLQTGEVTPVQGSRLGPTGKPPPVNLISERVPAPAQLSAGPAAVTSEESLRVPATLTWQKYAGMAARQNWVGELTPVNVTVLQKADEIAVIARISGLAETDEAPLRAAIGQIMDDDGRAVSQLRVNGHDIDPIKGLHRV